MFTPNVHELIQIYAKIGVEDWQKEKRNHEKAVVSCLAPIHLGESPYEAGRVMESDYDKLLPVPRSQGLYPAFFHVDLQHVRRDLYVRLELLAVFDEGHALAFRIERADDTEMSHAYPHSQLSKKMLLGKTIEPLGIPPKINVSYPAFSFRMTDPAATFLSFAMAIHGLEGGIADLLKRMFPGARARDYYDHLKRSLD